MFGPEQYRHFVSQHGESFVPSPLPNELAAFLKDRVYACVAQPTDRGTVLVVKAPGPDIRSVRGRVPMQLRHELYEHPQSPVIRLVTTVYDKPEHPLAFETFFNVADEQQRTDFAALQKQKRLLMLWYDEALQHRLTKGVTLGDPKTLTAILAQADRLRAAIPDDRFDFDAAKKAVMEAAKL
jgi:hypothetical protein